MSLISGIENFYASERGLPRFSVENFLSHSIKNLVYETFLQTSIPPLISIIYAKEGGITFSVKSFFHTVSKNFVENISVFQKN